MSKTSKNTQEKTTTQADAKQKSKTKVGSSSKEVIVTARIDPIIKKYAEALFDDLGLNMSAAINIFLRQCIRMNKIPFELSRTALDTDTIAPLTKRLQSYEDHRKKSK